MLRRSLRIVLVTALLVAAIPLPALADSVEFGARLDPEQEVPPTASGGDGEVDFTLRRDSIRFRLEWEDLTANVTAAHIHCAPAGVNGPVGVTLAMGPLDPEGRVRGSFTAPDAGNACGWTTRGDVIGAVFDGNAYVNVHTTTFPGGEIRGQLRIGSLEFETRMDARNEVPANDSDGEGEAELRARRDGVRFSVEWEDLTTPVIAGHIHCAATGVNGPVGVTLLMGPLDTDDRVRSSFTAPDAGTPCGWTTLGDVVGAIVDGNAYVNIHTQTFPGGEIRGQLRLD
jgi:Cu/Zn superoxide dismutase